MLVNHIAQELPSLRYEICLDHSRTTELGLFVLATVDKLVLLSFLKPQLHRVYACVCVCASSSDSQ